jgi:hypothetical protein
LRVEHVSWSFLFTWNSVKMPNFTGKRIPSQTLARPKLILLAADSIRILVATDSHVGYAERETLRKDDSWQAFDEVMSLAKSQDV